MKLIWSIVALLVFGTFLVLVLRSPVHPFTGRPPASAEVAPPAPASPPAKVEAEAKTVATASAAQPPAPLPAEPNEPAAAAAVKVEPAAGEAEPAKPSAPAVPAQVLEDLKSIEIPGIDRAVPAAGGAAVTIPSDPAFPAERLIPARAARNPDGSLRLDDRFNLPGSGTKEDPYRLSWDLLVSAQEVYKPRMGQKRLPERVTMLNGKYIELDGYVAFPITAASPKEALVMLNQWDGCCIGTPPTAYDAIEVKLSAAATPQQRFMTHGSIRGRFKVDPYEDGGWLLGLYLLEEAELTGKP
jgi:hypothetical protein